jgi:hypothetical protein
MFDADTLATLDAVDPAWAWAPFEPTADQSWDRTLAAHLYRRAAFAARPDELQLAQREGPAATVDRLLAVSGAEREAFYTRVGGTLQALLVTGNVEQLPAWWLYTMLHTPAPLLERIALFWHGHFATSAAKVTDVQMLHDQNDILRRHALGQFGPLLAEASRDPAMLVWLDSTSNRKAHPNENFAREVMELFTIGLGQYSERDIQEAARAFTGWEVRNGRFRFNAAQHDEGEKTVLGQTGPWNGDDVLRILLEQPTTARFLVRKLLRYLVTETAEPTDELVEPLAAGFRSRDYDIAWLVGTVLKSNLFYSPHAVGQRIRSPVEFALGLLRSLEGTSNFYVLAGDLRGLGQGVFFPPNVAGWEGGRAWINSATLLGRANLAWALASGADGRYGRKLELVPLVERHTSGGPADRARWLAELLLGEPPSDAVAVQLAALAGGAGDEQLRLARVVQAVAMLPAYQVG